MRKSQGREDAKPKRQLPKYRELVEPLTANFSNVWRGKSHPQDNSSLIIATESNGGFKWLFGDPTLEDIHYAKVERNFITRSITETSKGVFWKSCNAILPNIASDEELQVSAIGFSESGTYDLMKARKAAAFQPRALSGASNPFAVAMPGLTRRPVKTVRAAHIAVAKALGQAMGEDARLVQHVLVGVRVHRIRGKAYAPLRRSTQAIAVSPSTYGRDNFINITPETPEFRALLLADRFGSFLPVDELAGEAQRVSAAITGAEPETTGLFASPLPLLLRFSLSAPACFKTMIVTTLSDERLMRQLRTRDERENVKRIHNAIIRLARALMTLPRVRTSPVADPRRRSRSRSRSRLSAQQSRQTLEQRPPWGSSRRTPTPTPAHRRGRSPGPAHAAAARENEELKKRVADLSSELDALRAENVRLRREKDDAPAPSTALALERIRSLVSAQEERILEIEAGAEDQPYITKLRNACQRILRLIHRTSGQLDFQRLPSTLQKRIHNLLAIDDATIEMSELDEIIGTLETIGFGFISVVSFVCEDDSYY